MTGTFQKSPVVNLGNDRNYLDTPSTKIVSIGMTGTCTKQHCVKHGMDWNGLCDEPLNEHALVFFEIYL